MSIIQMTQKKSKAVQKMISYACQQSLPVGRLDKNTGNGDGACHRAKNNEEAPLPLRCIPTTFRQSAGSLQSPLAVALGR